MNNRKQQIIFKVMYFNIWKMFSVSAFRELCVSNSRNCQHSNQKGCDGSSYEMDFELQTASGSNNKVGSPSCVMLDKLLNFSVTPFPQLQNGMGFFSGTDGIMLMECCTQWLAHRKGFLFHVAYSEMLSCLFYFIYPYDSECVDQRKYRLCFYQQNYRQQFTRSVTAYKEVTYMGDQKAPRRTSDNFPHLSGLRFPQASHPL